MNPRNLDEPPGPATLGGSALGVGICAARAAAMVLAGSRPQRRRVQGAVDAHEDGPRGRTALGAVRRTVLADDDGGSNLPLREVALQRHVRVVQEGENLFRLPATALGPSPGVDQASVRPLRLQVIAENVHGLGDGDAQSEVQPRAQGRQPAAERGPRHRLRHAKVKPNAPL